MSDVVKESINRYCDEIRAPQPAYEILERNGFIGCSEADSELSATCKETHTARLQAKLGDP